MNIMKEMMGRSGSRRQERKQKGFSVSYLGLSYATQPSPEELHRIVNVLLANNHNQHVSTNNSCPSARIVSNLKSVTITRDMDNTVVCELQMTKVVFCCVDAKHQKTLAIFYHNDDYMADYTRGLECHLIQGKTKDVTRKLAKMLGDQVMESFAQRKELDKVKATEHGKKLSYANYIKSPLEEHDSSQRYDEAKLTESTPVKKVSPPKPPRASLKLKKVSVDSNQNDKSFDVSDKKIDKINDVSNDGYKLQPLNTAREINNFQWTIDRNSLLILASLSETDL